MEIYYLISAYILAGVFGLCVGSFLNVVIYRLPNNMNLAKPDSHSPVCKYKLKHPLEFQEGVNLSIQNLCLVNLTTKRNPYYYVI